MAEIQIDARQPNMPGQAWGAYETVLWQPYFWNNDFEVWDRYSHGLYFRHYDKEVRGLQAFWETDAGH